MDTNKNLTVKNWQREDQPREKLLEKGQKHLSNTELLAILLRSGVAGKNVLEVSKEILNEADNSLSKLSRYSVNELISRHKGIGEAKAVSIIAALELGYRMLSETIIANDMFIRDSRDLYSLLASKIGNLDTEEFWAVFMNTHKKVIGEMQVNKGGLTTTSVDIRVIMQKALERNAVYFAVAHNHPTGNLTPSSADKTLTARLQEAGKLMNIALIDHIIVGIGESGKPSYYSFHDEGYL